MDATKGMKPEHLKEIDQHSIEVCQLVYRLSRGPGDAILVLCMAIARVVVGSKLVPDGDTQLPGALTDFITSGIEAVRESQGRAVN